MRKKVQYLMGVISFCLLLLVCAQPVQAASAEEVTGTCKFSEAYDALEILNKKRIAQGLGELVMDKDLLEAAMLRAAELTISFDHIRPNGSSCFTACDKMYAENIAYGYSSASDVITAWYNSTTGHRENMMNSDYKSIGIGCFYKDGICYWVQNFGYVSATKTSQPSNVKRTYKVALTSDGKTQLSSSESLSSKVKGFKATVTGKKITLKWTRKTDISGYQIQVSTSKSFGKKDTYILGKNKVKKVIRTYKGKALKSGAKYYVRIRAYKKTTESDGTVTKKYSKWKTIRKKIG